MRLAFQNLHKTRRAETVRAEREKPLRVLKRHNAARRLDFERLRRRFAHQLDILKRRAARLKAGGRLDIIRASRGDDTAEMPFFVVCQQARLDDDLQNLPRAGILYRADLVFHEVIFAALHRADRDHHIDLVRAVFDGVARLEHLRRRRVVAVRKADDSADLHSARRVLRRRLDKARRNANARGLKADVVVDAIFGTGFHGNLRAPFSIWIPTVNECADHVVSIDVPSGLNAETGVVDDDCIRAERTVTMIAPKIGLYSADGPEYAGDLVCGGLYDRLDEVIDDVDHAAEIVEPGDLVDYFAPLPTNIDKYSRGSALIVAGSAQYPGAAIMAAKSAARAGAGYVAVATPDACANLIRMALPSIPVFAIPSDSRGSFGAAARMTVCEIAKKYSCVVCGPGMTTSAGSMQVVSGLLELDVPLILDADALNCLAKIAIDGIDSNPEMYRREQPLVMTPHYRELSRLVAGDEVNDLGTAIAAAQKIVWAAGSDNLVVIAKGPTTAICGVERVLLPLSGPASLATAGSGDVLAGILAGTLATMRDEMDRWELLYSYAVALHSYAGFAAATEYGEKSVIATDLIDLIGPAMELAAKDALDDLGIMDEGSDD